MDIKYIKEGQDSLKELLVKHIEQTDKRFEHQEKKNDQKYATKLTERIVFGMAGIILATVVVGITALVIR